SARHVRSAFDVHALEVRLVGAGLSKRSGEVTNAVRAAQCVGECFRLEYVATPQTGAATAQLLDAGPMFRPIAAIQAHDIVTLRQGTLDKVRTDETAGASHE